MYSKIAGFSKRATSSTTLEKPFEANIYHSAAAGKTGHRIQLFPEKLPPAAEQKRAGIPTCKTGLTPCCACLLDSGCFRKLTENDVQIRGEHMAPQYWQSRPGELRAGFHFLHKPTNIGQSLLRIGDTLKPVKKPASPDRKVLIK